MSVEERNSWAKKDLFELVDACRKGLLGNEFIWICVDKGYECTEYSKGYAIDDYCFTFEYLNCEADVNTGDIY